jgi:hypothetical protein
VAGHLRSTPLKRTQGPSIQAILIVSVILIILFLWLNFVLTQQIESIGREIQEKAHELNGIERHKDALLSEISATASQQEMARRAWALNYRPQTPVYLPLAEHFVQENDAIADSGQQFAPSASREESAAQQSALLFSMLARQSETLAETLP